MAGFNDLESQLQQLQQQHAYRRRKTIESAQGVWVQVDGERKLNFCSNDYLGLADHPQVRGALQEAVNHWGVGSGAAHLVCGHSREHHALEEELAAFTGRERALLFSTGYMANLGVLVALLGRDDLVLQDRLNHASLLDGALLCRATFKRFPHADISHLQQLLHLPAQRKLVVTDGVFSMDGDLAALPELAASAKAADAWLMVDDAHGLGVLGANGAGILEHFALTTTDVPVLVGTLGKAFGTAGAFVAGSEVLIETLIQKARTYIYTTAMPAAVAAATRASLRIIQTETWRRAHLQALITQFRQGAAQLGLNIMPSYSPIQPIQVGDSAAALAASARLWQQGMLVGAIRPPTVPAGSARLRVTLSAAHSSAHVARLLNALASSIDA